MRPEGIIFQLDPSGASRGRTRKDGGGTTQSLGQPRRSVAVVGLGRHVGNDSCGLKHQQWQNIRENVDKKRELIINNWATWCKMCCFYCNMLTRTEVELKFDHNFWRWRCSAPTLIGFKGGLGSESSLVTSHSARFARCFSEISWLPWMCLW